MRGDKARALRGEMPQPSSMTVAAEGSRAPEVKRMLSGEASHWAKRGVTFHRTGHRQS